jgi:hypothetical protein
MSGMVYCNRVLSSGPGVHRVMGLVSDSDKLGNMYSPFFLGQWYEDYQPMNSSLPDTIMFKKLMNF